jgi:hypothetical protein
MAMAMIDLALQENMSKNYAKRADVFLQRRFVDRNSYYYRHLKKYSHDSKPVGTAAITYISVVLCVGRPEKDILVGFSG